MSWENKNIELYRSSIMIPLQKNGQWNHIPSRQLTAPSMNYKMNKCNRYKSFENKEQEQKYSIFVGYIKTYQTFRFRTPNAYTHLFKLYPVINRKSSLKHE
jgi:hypothetical protein